MLTKDEIIEKVGKIFKPSHMVAYIQTGKDVYANVFLGDLSLDDIVGEITGSIGIPMNDGETYLYNIFVSIDVNKDEEAYEVYRTALYNCGYPFRSESVEINAFSDRLEWHMYGESRAGVFIVDEVSSLLEDMTADAQAAQKYLNEIARSFASKFLRSVNRVKDEAGAMRTKKQIMDAVYAATSQRNWFFDEKRSAVYAGALMHSLSAVDVEIDIEVLLIIPCDPVWETESKIVVTIRSDDAEQLDSWNSVVKIMGHSGFVTKVEYDDYTTTATFESNELFKSGDLTDDIKQAVANLNPALQEVLKELRGYLREFTSDFGG